MGLLALGCLTGLGSCFIFLPLSSYLLVVNSHSVNTLSILALNKNFNGLEQFDTHTSTRMFRLEQCPFGLHKLWEHLYW